MADQPEARRRLAALMNERRLDLNLTWREVAERGRVSMRALGYARTGDDEIRPLTQAGIETGLGWERGSVSLILDGGDPVPLGGAVVPLPPAAANHRAPVLLERNGALFPPSSPGVAARAALYTDQIKGRILVAAADHPEVPPDGPLRGEWVWPGSPPLAWAWDDLTARGFTWWQLAQSFAVVMGDRLGDSGDATGLARPGRSATNW